MHPTQDRDHGTQANRAHNDTISYRRQAPRGRSEHDAATNNLIHGVGSIDALGSSLYPGSSYLQPQVAYDPYRYGYEYYASETSSSNVYYPMQPRASHGSEFIASIFGWPLHNHAISSRIPLRARTSVRVQG